MNGEGNVAAAVGGRAAQTVATRFAVALLGVVAGVIVARAFGPSGKGAYNAVTAFVSVPAAVMYGAASAIMFTLVRERRSMHETFPAIAFTYGSVAVLLAGAAAVYGVLRGWNPVSVTLAASLPAAIILALRDGYYISVSRIAWMNAQTFALQIFLVAGAGAAASAHAPLSVVLWAYAASNYICAAVVVVDMVRDAHGWDGADLRERLRGFLRIAAPSGLNGGLGVLNYRVDSYVLLGLLGVASFGIYSIAVNAGEILFWLSRPIGAVMSREIGGSNSERSAELTACTIRTSVALSALCGIVLILCAPSLIQAVYGPRFAPSADPLRLLIPGIVAFSSSTAFAAYFIVQLGRPFAMTAMNAAMIAVQAASCVALVPRYGLAGAALGCTITYAFGAAVNTWYFCRCSGMSPFEVWIVQRRDMQRLKRAIAGVVPRAFTVGAVRRP